MSNSNVLIPIMDLLQAIVQQTICLLYNPKIPRDRNVTIIDDEVCAVENCLTIIFSQIVTVVAET